MNKQEEASGPVREEASGPVSEEASGPVSDFFVGIGLLFKSIGWLIYKPASLLASIPGRVFRALIARKHGLKCFVWYTLLFPISVFSIAGAMHREWSSLKDIDHSKLSDEDKKKFRQGLQVLSDKTSLSCALLGLLGTTIAVPILSITYIQPLLGESFRGPVVAGSTVISLAIAIALIAMPVIAEKPLIIDDDKKEK